MTFDPLADWWVWPVLIRRALGSDSGGQLIEAAPGSSALASIDDRRRMVRSPSGDLVVSETTVSLPVSTPAVPIGSLVTLPAEYGGRTTKVLAVTVARSGQPDSPEHVAVSCE